MKISYALALVSAIVLATFAFPAGAQPYNRTFVSGTNGTNVSTCGLITSPCALFSIALAHTNPGGEIDCLTPGDFGAVTISISVSIICDGVSNGGILATSGIAIAITGTSGTVIYLSGLDINGLAGAATNGIQVDTGSTLYINHSTIRSFSGIGVDVQSTTNPTRVFIKDSTILHNGTGVYVQGEGGATNSAILTNTVVDGNSGYAASAYGADSYIALENTVLTGSPTGLSLQNGATGELIGPSNTIAGEIIGSPTSVLFK